jgi:hypothetical protein
MQPHEMPLFVSSIERMLGGEGPASDDYEKEPVNGVQGRANLGGHPDLVRGVRFYSLCRRMMSSRQMGAILRLIPVGLRATLACECGDAALRAKPQQDLTGRCQRLVVARSVGVHVALCRGTSQEGEKEGKGSEE